MFVNGFIEVETITGGGLINGIPIQGTTTYSSKIPCNIQKNTENNKGDYKDGKFTQFFFTVWITKQSFNAKRIRLTDNRGVIKGVFETQSITHNDLVQRIKIVV